MPLTCVIQKLFLVNSLRGVIFFGKQRMIMIFWFATSYVFAILIRPLPHYAPLPLFPPKLTN